MKFILKFPQLVFTLPKIKSIQNKKSNKFFSCISVVLTVIHRAPHAMVRLSHNAFSVSQIDFRWKENVLHPVQMAFMAIKREKSAFLYVFFSPLKIVKEKFNEWQ